MSGKQVKPLAIFLPKLLFNLLIKTPLNIFSKFYKGNRVF